MIFVFPQTEEYLLEITKTLQTDFIKMFFGWLSFAIVDIALAWFTYTNILATGTLLLAYQDYATTDVT